MIGAEQGGHRYSEYRIDVEVILAALYCRQTALGGVVVPAAAAREIEHTAETR